MAGTLRRFLWQSPEGFYEEQSYTDWAKFEKLTMQPVVANDAVVDAAGGKIVGVPDVTVGASGTDAVNKNYVDSVAQGLQMKDVVEAVNTGSALASPPTGLPLLDGVYTYDGDRVLLTTQADAKENGIWIAHGVHAFLDLGGVATLLDTEIEATLGGTSGNSVTIATVADGTGAGTITRSINALTFHYQTGVTTVANFEAAVAALTGADKLIVVKTAGTGTNVLTSPGDTFAATNLASGAASVMTRPSDFLAGSHAHGAFTLSIGGTSWQGSGWVCTNTLAGGDVVGTNTLNFVQFSAAQNVTASHGIELVGSDIQAKPGDGLKLTDTVFTYIEVNATTNGGLTFTGTSPAKTVGVLANAGQGINVGASGVGITLATDPGLQFNTGLEAKLLSTGGLQKASTGLSIKQNAADTGLTIDVNGVLVNSAPKVAEKMTVSSSVTAARCVYVSGNDTVAMASSSADATARVIGIAPVTIASGSGLIIHHGICQNVLAGAGVANTPYYLGASGELVLAASVGAAKRMLCVGYALNANDLFVDIKDYGKKAA